MALLASDEPNALRDVLVEMKEDQSRRVGMVVVVAREAVDSVQTHLSANGCKGSYPIGEIISGSGKVVNTGALDW